MDLIALRNQERRYIVGLMSGTSCDGVDAALVRIKGTGADLQIKLVSFSTTPYPEKIKLRLLAPRMDAAEVCALNVDIGEFMAGAAKAAMDAAPKSIKVDFVATSGHTVAHLPPRGNQGRGTLQIGEPAILAQLCGVPIVSDFRQRDMAAGGQGAPLVPYADWVLFRRDYRTVALLNIGGIANVTVVTPKFENVMAFDTGPGNMAIDGAVRLLTAGKKQYDKDGEAGMRGVVIDEFLDYLLDHPFFQEEPPKSTGREEFGPEVYLRDAIASRKSQHSYDDLIATVTTAVAFSIIRAHNRFIKPKYEIERLIISGGGAHNHALLQRIKQGFAGVVVRTSDRYNIPADAREAIAFAILGNETICGTPANVPQATGAKSAVVLGKITPL